MHISDCFYFFLPLQETGGHPYMCFSVYMSLQDEFLEGGC